jgi:hypothetical protein
MGKKHAARNQVCIIVHGIMVTDVVAKNVVENKDARQEGNTWSMFGFSIVPSDFMLQRGRCKAIMVVGSAARLPRLPDHISNNTSSLACPRPPTRLRCY